MKPRPLAGSIVELKLATPTNKELGECSNRTGTFQDQRYIGKTLEGCKLWIHTDISLTHKEVFIV